MSIIIYNLTKETSESIKADELINYEFHLLKVVKNYLIISCCNAGAACLISLYNLKKKERIFKIGEPHTANCEIDSTLLCDEKKGNFVISCGSYSGIKIYDFKSKILRQKNIDEYFYFVKMYKYENKDYIMAGHDNKVLLYNFENLSEFKIFTEKDIKANGFKDAIILKNEDTNILELITSCYQPNKLIFFNFNTNEKIKEIKSDSFKPYNLLEYKNNFIIASCVNGSCKIINIKISKIIESIDIFDYLTENTLKKIIHPKYGECFLIYGFEKNPKYFILN